MRVRIGAGWLRTSNDALDLEASKHRYAKLLSATVESEFGETCAIEWVDGNRVEVASPPDQPSREREVRDLAWVVRDLGQWVVIGVTK